MQNKTDIMANIEKKFEKPTKDNVKIGDFIVVVEPGIPGLAPSPVYGLAKITKITDDRIEGDFRDNTKSIRYSDSIVLKKNGKYLVGECIQEHYTYSKSSN